VEKNILNNGFIGEPSLLSWEERWQSDIAGV
jgi:hypothetical protein